MSETPPKNRRWFVILAAITLAGTLVFVGWITICALRIPELKKARFGVWEGKTGVRPC
jgi:hypothetical protein